MTAINDLQTEYVVIHQDNRLGDHDVDPSGAITFIDLDAAIELREDYEEPEEWFIFRRRTTPWQDVTK